MSIPSRARLRAWFEFGGDPDRLPMVMVRVLVVALGVLSIVGLSDVMRSGTWDDYVQPVVSFALMGWGIVMIRRNRPRPIPILLVAAAGAALFVIGAAAFDELGSVRPSGPLMIMGIAGVLAMAAGRRRVGLLATVLLAATGVTVALIHLGRSAVVIFSEVTTALVVMAAGLWMVRVISRAFDLGVERYRGLFDAAAVAFIEVDLDGAGPQQAGRVSRLNPAAAHMVEQYRRITTQGTVESLTDAVIAGIARDGATTGTTVVPVPTEEGTRTLLTSWNVLSAGKNRMVASVVDITDHERAANALADQVRAKDLFIATVSHELRTPLTAIQGVLELLADAELDDPEERREFTAIALQETRDMSGIIQDLLVLARRDTDALVINPAPTALEPLLHKAVDTASAGFSLDVTPGLEAICDGIRVRQILRNLLANAVSYGGPARRVEASRLGDRVVIEVSDDGPAIDPDVADRLFEAYETGAGHRPTGSMGLGLNVSRTLARLMGGDLAHRRVDDRTVFALDLPAAGIDENASSAAAAAD